MKFLSKSLCLSYREFSLLVFGRLNPDDFLEFLHARKLAQLFEAEVDGNSQVPDIFQLTTDFG